MQRGFGKAPDGKSREIRHNKGYGGIRIYIAARQGHLRGMGYRNAHPHTYGELTNDEFFVTEKAASKGIKITNTSATEPIVMLKHFAENPELTI